MKINDIIQQQGIIYDRSLSTPLELPYSNFDTIKIKQNDTVTNFNINDIITKLYANYLQLYRYAYMSSNVMPITSIGTIGVSGNNLSIYRGLSSSQFQPFNNVGFSGLGNTPTIAVKYNSELNTHALFATTGQALVGFTCNDTFTSIVSSLSSSTLFENSSVYWQSITDIVFGDDNSLYVLDSTLPSIVKYNASGFLTDNNVLRNTLVYQSYIGGKGDYNETTKFNQPNSIAYYDSELYVLDAGNKCIKKYDKNLNWEITYRLFRDFHNVSPKQIRFDKTGTPYVLMSDNRLFVYNSNFTEKEIINVTPLSGDNTKVQGLCFSASDPNIMYLYTDRHVYKRLISRPDDYVGRYSITRFLFNTEQTVKSMTSVRFTYDGTAGDCNLVTYAGPEGGKIALFYDNINTATVLTTGDFDVYPLSSIVINPDEYLQNWVINKSISKLLVNHMRLRDCIGGKFLFKKDSMSGDLLLTGNRYLLPAELTAMRFQQDITNYIGLNEVFQNTTINRPFEYIYNIQVSLLNVLQAETQNYFDRSQIVFI